jgi:hypothetical protein
MIRCMWSPDRILKTGALLLATLLVPVVATSGGNLLHDVPDFTQTDVRGAASGNGQQYCAPVAVANSFMWLGEDTQDQLLLIEKLASRDYMNTSLKNGTGTTGVLRGADKLAIEMFGGYAQLEYVGISTIGSGTLTGNKSGLPTSAKGYMRLGKGMHVKSSADTAIVDGVVKLIL